VFETLTYAAVATDYSVGGASGPEETRSLSPQGAAYPARFSDIMASFLLRVAAYFQGCLSSLPILERPCHGSLPQERLTVADSSVDDITGPLMVVLMNRHLSRRLRWLIRRGRVERSGEMREATPEDKARCNLSPGQFSEYCIRVHGHSRIRTYGFGLGRRALRRIAICGAGLQGSVDCLAKAALCRAPLSPD